MCQFADCQHFLINTEILTDEFPMVQNASKLLDSLEHNTGSSIKPSRAVIAFLNQIDSADPNSQDISEDETNGNWGHHQFTSGDMQCAMVLTSWDKIGVPTA